MHKTLLSEEEIRATGVLDNPVPQRDSRHMTLLRYVFKLSDETIENLRSRDYTIVQMAHSICENILKKPVALHGCGDIEVQPYAAIFGFYQNKEATGPTKREFDDVPFPVRLEFPNGEPPPCPTVCSDWDKDRGKCVNPHVRGDAYCTARLIQLFPECPKDCFRLDTRTKVCTESGPCRYGRIKPQDIPPSISADPTAPTNAFGN